MFESFDRVDWTMFALLAAVVLGVVGVTVWAVVSGGASCPKGQHRVLLSYASTWTGKSLIMVPIYGCAA